MGAFTHLAHAGNVYWDTNLTTAGAGGATPSGSWDTTATSNWNTDSTGGAGGTLAPWNNANGDTAVFSAGADATGSYTMTIPASTPITLAGITREDGTAIVSSTAGSALTFSGGNLAVDAGSAAGQLQVLAPLDVSPTATVTKTGTASAFFNQTQGTFSGKWIINAGSLGFNSDTCIGVVPGAPVSDMIQLNNGSIRSSNTTAQTFDGTRGIKLGTGGGSFDGANNFTWAGQISGTTSLTIAGTETVTLTNTANNYGGSTFIGSSTGNLVLGAADVIPDTSVVSFSGSVSNTLTMNGATETIKAVAGNTSGVVAFGNNTLTVNPSLATDNFSYAGTFTGSSSSKFIKNGAGIQRLAGSGSAFHGEVDLNAGTLGINNNTALGDGKLVISGGTISVFNATQRTLTSGSYDVSSSFNVDDTFFNGPGALSMNNGIMTLKATNPTIFVGHTTGGLGGSVALTIGAVIADDATPGRGFTKDGNGLLTLSGNNNYTGATTLSAGTISIGGANTNPVGIGGTLTLAGGTFTTTGSRNVNSAPINNPLSVTDNTALTTTAGATSIDLNFTSNTISGTAAKLLTIRNDSTAGNTTFQPRFTGAFTYNGDIAITNGTSTNNTVLQSFNTSTTGDQTFNGVISGTGSFVRTATTAGTGGATIFNGANNYSGGTTLTRGSIGFGISTTGSPGSITSGPIGTGTLSNTVADSAIFASNPDINVGNAIQVTGTIVVKGTNNLTLSGAITGDGSITKTGGSTLVLTNSANNYAGFTTVSAGTLIIQQSPATHGNVTVTGGLLQLSHSGSNNNYLRGFSFSVTGGKLDVTNNKLIGSGTVLGTPTGGVYTGGSAQRMIHDGFNNGAWNGNGIITSETYAAGNSALTTLAAAKAGDIGYGGTVTFASQSVSATDTLVMYTYNGDMNLDGTINGDDYTRIDAAFVGSPYAGGIGYENGDLNYDGKINADDYFIIDKNYGHTTDLGTFPHAPALGGLSGVSAVPEPTSLALLGIASSMILRRRRHRIS